ncbi:hypothetical protein [Phosphitispora sp. TUW77]|uniref:hypothetical protein n=1 Tax=Phosphitispora sp. TUW77 TaxID=3152361 RepID=UPI003AB85B8D
MNNRREFTYKDGYSYFSTRLLPIPIVMFFLVFIFIWSQFPRDLVFDVMAVASIILIVIGILIFLNIYPEIRTEDNHIELVFPFKSYNINYDNILKMVELERRTSQKLLRVDLTKLSTVNNLIGLLFGSGGKPSFLVTRSISGYSELLNILEQRTGLTTNKQLYWF